MGRKSSAKSPGNPPPSTESAFSSYRLIAVLVTLVALAGGFTYWRGSRLQPEAAGQPAAPPVGEPVAQAVAPAPAAAPLGPHPQANLPPLPFNSGTLPRSPEAVRAAYRFAAEHPEVLSYVPCYCGCENAGHRGSEDCFVKARDDKGDVIEWDPHGANCAVCLDIARDAMQMYSSGASVRDIRAATEKKWDPTFPTRTPTPQPPAPPTR